MLRQVAQMSEADRRAAAAQAAPLAGQAPGSEMPDALRELVAAHDVLRSGREAARQAVFRPSHNLPTRTLAEQVCSWHGVCSIYMILPSYNPSRGAW